MASAIFTVKSAATPPMPRPRIPRRSFTKKGPGKEAKLSFMGHTLMENRNGLIVAAGHFRDTR
jgi:hypothetical protein